MSIGWLFFLVTVVAHGSLGAPHSKLKETGFIDYKPGTLNVILAAPHGGGETPTEIPDRTAGCWDGSNCIWRHDCGQQDTSRCGATTVRDSFTLELTELLREELFLLFGEYPSTVINLLHRRKLDANRLVDEATFGVPLAVEAWTEFHTFINQSKEAVGGPALFFDMHGHGHLQQWAELGYLITGSNLDSGSFNPEGTSIRSLHQRAGLPFEDILRGEFSFGGILEGEGFDSVPAPQYPGPSGASYFSGGDNTRMHGSRDGGVVDAIQIESPSSFRAANLRPQYAKALAETIFQFVDLYY